MTLACGIFDAVCALATIHPATDYRTIVQNAAALIRLGSSPVAGTAGLGTVDRVDVIPTSGGVADSLLAPLPDGDTALQALLDMMAENGMEWSTNLFNGDFQSGLLGLDPSAA